jgi:hypothetical protein
VGPTGLSALSESSIPFREIYLDALEGVGADNVLGFVRACKDSLRVLSVHSTLRLPTTFLRGLCEIYEGRRGACILSENRRCSRWRREGCGCGGLIALDVFGVTLWGKEVRPLEGGIPLDVVWRLMDALPLLDDFVCDFNSVGLEDNKYNKNEKREEEGEKEQTEKERDVVGVLERFPLLLESSETSRRGMLEGHGVGSGQGLLYDRIRRWHS